MNFQIEILHFFGPIVKSEFSAETEIRNLSVHLSQSQTCQNWSFINSNFFERNPYNFVFFNLILLV